MSHLTQLLKKKRRFQGPTEQELALKKARLCNQNTLNAEKHADKAFKDFLRETGAVSVEYTLYSERELDKYLTKFWFGARMEKNEYYQVNTLPSFRYGLSRILKNFGHELDITKSPSFQDSIEAFELAVKKLKEKGKGYVNSAKEITEQG